MINEYKIQERYEDYICTENVLQLESIYNLGTVLYDDDDFDGHEKRQYSFHQS